MALVGPKKKWKPREIRSLSPSQMSSEKIGEQKQIPANHVQADQVLFLLFFPTPRPLFISFLAKSLSRLLRRKCLEV